MRNGQTGSTFGTIRRRGRGWNVVIRVDGVRHEFGPRKDPQLRGGVLDEKGVRGWMLRKRAELRVAAWAAALQPPGHEHLSVLQVKVSRATHGRLGDAARNAGRLPEDLARVAIERYLGETEADRG